MSAAFPAARRDALLEDGELVVLEQRHRVGHRLEVVEERDRAVVEALGQARGVHEPGDVGQAGDQAGHRARGADARGVHGLIADVVEERVHHLAEAVEVERGELADDERPRALGRAVPEESEQSLRAADVTGEEHGDMIVKGSVLGF